MVDFDPFDPLDDPLEVDPAEQEARRGLPQDWAHAATQPIRIELPNPGWRKLGFRYAGMGPSTLDDLLLRVGRHSRRFPPTCVLLESDYIDADYRDEYSNFYSKVFRELPSRCERLHFFGSDGTRERYIGYIVLRPILGRPVGRTMLLPPQDVINHVSCTAVASATPYGYPADVRGFPYISQDEQFGSCAHAAIWMVALYFHLRFRRRRLLMSDIIATARRHQDVHPTVPASGLTHRQIIAVLSDLDMAPVSYSRDRLPVGEDVASIACRYLNGGLPVVMLVQGRSAGHVQVLIGYRRTEEGELRFILHDDQSGAYLETSMLGPRPDEDEQPAAGLAHVGRRGPFARLRAALRRRPPVDAGPQGVEAVGPHGPWDALIVPTPGKVYLSGEVAESSARLIFEEALDDIEDLAVLRGGFADGRLRTRAYLTEISQYKRRLHHRGMPRDAVRWHVNVSGSHWVWVIELQDRQRARSAPECVLGEIVFDATSDDNWPNPMCGSVPGRLMKWPRLGDNMAVADIAPNMRPYRTGCGLHVWS